MIMLEKNFNFRPPPERRLPLQQPQPENAERIKKPRLENKDEQDMKESRVGGKLNKTRFKRRPLGTKEDYAIPEKARSAKPGHKAEQAICNWLKNVPGVSDAYLSSNMEDKEKVDILVRFSGDSEPVKIQVSMNPEKTTKGLSADISLIKFRPTDIRDGEITPSLQKKIAKKIIGQMPDEQREGLLGYHGID